MDVGKHAMECYFNDSQGGGIQILVLEGYGLLKPDAIWMDSIHFHYSTLRETFRRLSYYQHFTLMEVASGHGSPGRKPETNHNLLPMHSKPWLPGVCVLVRCETSKIAMQEDRQSMVQAFCISFAFAKPCFLFSAFTMRVKRKELPSHNPPVSDRYTCLAHYPRGIPPAAVGHACPAQTNMTV